MFLFDSKAVAALDGRPQAMGFVQARKTLLGSMAQAVLSHGKHFFEIPETLGIVFSFLIHKNKVSGFGCRVSVVGGNNLGITNLGI